MRVALALGMLVVALSMLAGANGDEKSEPSPIPQNLRAQAKKSFDNKLPYFLWTEEKLVSPKDLKIRYATNPDQRAEPASTVFKFSRTVRGMNVPYAEYAQGIVTATAGPGDFKGIVEVTIYLIREADQLKEDKAPAISNTVKLKAKFE